MNSPGGNNLGGCIRGAVRYCEFSPYILLPEMRFSTRSVLAALCVVSLSSLYAGRYPAAGTQTFTYANGTANLADGTTIETNNATATAVTNNTLRLTVAGTGGTTAAFKIPNLDSGNAVAGLDASFTLKMKRWFAGNTPADGWSINFGNIPAGFGGGEGGFVMTNGLAVAFDTYQNDASDAPSIEVFCNGVSVGNFPASGLTGGGFPMDDDTFRPVVLHWDEEGLDLSYNGQVVFNNLGTPGFVPAAGGRFAFSARTGGSTQDVLIDDLLLLTAQRVPVETGGPVISEFMAENKSILEDEDTDTSDWIEIYNGQNVAVNLSGWKLTNASGGGGWMFPSISMGPYTYKTVYASGKNRINVAGQLHTNFTLEKTGGYLALIRPNNTAASQFTYGNQFEDISYGEKGAARTLGFMLPPTPSAAPDPSGYQAPEGPGEDVVYLKGGLPTDGGLFPTTFQVTFQAPVAAGAVIRYTTNNTMPTAGSTAWTPGTNFSVAASSTYRARVFTPGKLPGKANSRTWLKLDTNLANYNASGSPFSSHLPVLVIDSFGFPVDSYTDPGQARPYRLSYAVLLDRDPLATAPNANRALITGKVDFQGRCGTHVRGESSSGFAQKSYSWELWDEDGNDKDSSLLNLPEESDWVLHGPYTDKTLMRNYTVYASMLENAGAGSAMRTRFVEVFFNQQANNPVDYGDYRGVYVLVEKIKSTKDRVDLEKLNELTTDPALITGGYILKHDKPSIGNSNFSTSLRGVNIQGADPEVWNSAQQTYLQTFMGQFESALYGANFANPTTGYSAYIDVDSFIDNQWWIEIAKQIDGYRISAYYSKDRAGKLRALPVWDYNLSLMNADYLGGDQFAGWYYTQLGSGDYYWYPRLHEDGNYRLRHWDRYWQHRRSIWDTSAMHARMNSYAAEVLNGSATNVSNSMAALPPLQENAAMRHYRKFPVLGTYLWPNAGGHPSSPATLNPRPWQVNTTYQLEVGAMKTWLEQRLGWIDDQNRVGSVIYRPPNFSQNGGNVAAGFQLSISAFTGTPPAGTTYATGTLYYTIDGNDPRAANGAIAGTAYSGPLTLNASTTVQARLHNAGQWSPVTKYQFIVDAAPASALNLVVSEFSYNPLDPVVGSAEYNAGYTDANDFEYIELTNLSAGNVDLTGCEIVGGVGFDFADAAPATLTVPPGGRVLIVENRLAFLMRYGNGAASKIAGEFTGNLSNSGESFSVLDKNDDVIATVTYGITEPWPAQADGSGYSMVLRNPGPTPNYGSPTSWRTSATIGGSPGGTDVVAFTGSPTEDTDGDGFSDFLEYAMGSNWNAHASHFLPAADMTTYPSLGLPGTYLRFRFRESLAASGFTARPMGTRDMQVWGTVDVAYVKTVNNGDGSATVEYRSTQPIGSGPSSVIMRLVVTPQ
jgi:hypothetical protein